MFDSNIIILLTKVSIKNFALIDSLEIDFLSGFSTITGDTGSGKSILLNALSLIIGKRADHNLLKNDKLKCIIEAEFNLSNYNLNKIFKQNDLDYFQHSILRREVLPNGKSRSFVNDTPVNLDIMRSIGEKLIDIHTQNQSLILSNDQFFFSLIDSLSEQQNIVNNFSHNLILFKELNNELEKLNRLNVSLQNDYDYNDFLLNELSSAELCIDEQNNLEENLKALKNSEEILNSLHQIDNLIQNDSNCIENQIRNLNFILSNISKYSNKYSDIKNRVESILIELDDIKLELRDSSSEFNNNPLKSEEMESRLNLIYSLQKKHSVNSVSDLLDVQNNLQKKLDDNDSIGIDIENLKNEILIKESLLKELSKKISISRKKILPNLKIEIESILSTLGMENSSFIFNLKKSENYNKYGNDLIEVLFSANKGIDFSPIFKVVSGGELSRILLSIKSILSDHLNLPTMIFDEIDTGISGEMSNAMANLMLKMSKKMQIISITHLPQIAAKGEHHFNVYKYEKLGTTNTKIKKLNNDERVEEIAKMLSGDQISSSALTHAKELLN
ncbi:MAG: DNA repair protein RecN [Flavobacteriaceae bacterium]|nr:DNA repair protein RecN [Flavobacteriaceae bacterium]RCL67746.1 MAG: DNA repair protein RecN [Cryomorphaceae bacterium]